MIQEKIYTFDEVADILRTSKQTLRKTIENGELNAFKVGSYKYKITEASLTDYINKKIEK